MKGTRNRFHWFYPFIVGIIAFNVLRVITDLTKHDTFWHGDKRSHILSLVSSILFCYIMDLIWRSRLRKSDKFKSTLKEYLYVFIELTIFSTVFLFLGNLAGALFTGNLLNRFLMFISYIPLLMLYYTLIRNDIANKNYQEKIVQLEKIKVDQAETELKLLKAQYHPHFLFNALNTVYFQIDEKNKEARQSIEQLSDLLRYRLYDMEKEVTMEQEISYLKSYIAFQQLRMNERFVLDIYFDPELKTQKIHPLLFQPLIENAFKYVKGDYKIKLELRLTDSQILFKIENTILENWIFDRKNKGIGIENLKRRLSLLYPNKYSLDTDRTESLFIAKLTIRTD